MTQADPLTCARPDMRSRAMVSVGSTGIADRHGTAPNIAKPLAANTEHHPDDEIKETAQVLAIGHGIRRRIVWSGFLSGDDGWIGRTSAMNA